MKRIYIDHTNEATFTSEPYTALMNDLKWMPLENRRYDQRMCVMYKITHQLVAVPPTQLVPPTRTTRGHSLKYQTIRTTCRQTKDSFYPRSMPDWNRLPPEHCGSSIN